MVIGRQGITAMSGLPGKTKSSANERKYTQIIKIKSKVTVILSEAEGSCCSHTI